MTNQPTTSILYDIPIEGSLGLLALGAQGIEAWRQKRDAHLNQSANPIPAEPESHEKENN